MKGWKALKERRSVMAIIKIKGMSCGHCVGAVTGVLESVDGISDVRVDLEKGQAEFLETAPVDMDRVAELIRDAGYEVV